MNRDVSLQATNNYQLLVLVFCCCCFGPFLNTQQILPYNFPTLCVPSLCVLVFPNRYIIAPNLLFFALSYPIYVYNKKKHAFSLLCISHPIITLTLLTWFVNTDENNDATRDTRLTR